MMKSFFASRVLAAIVLVLTLTTTFASTSHAKPGDQKLYRDPGDVTLPFDFPLDFPWGTIEGIWETIDLEERMLFSFEVASDAGCRPDVCDKDRQILKVVQIDSHMTGAIVATGTGIKLADSNQVRAGMVSTVGGKSYMLFVGAFEDRSSPLRPKVNTVLTLNAFDSEEPAFSTKIRLISKLPVRTSKSSN